MCVANAVLTEPRAFSCASPISKPTFWTWFPIIFPFADVRRPSFELMAPTRVTRSTP